MQVFCTLGYKLCQPGQPPRRPGSFFQSATSPSELVCLSSLHCCISACLHLHIGRLVWYLRWPCRSRDTCPCHVTEAAPSAIWGVLVIILSIRNPSWRGIEAQSVTCGSARCSPRMPYPCLQPGSVPCVCRPHLRAWAILIDLLHQNVWRPPSMRLSAGEGRKEPGLFPHLRGHTSLVLSGWPPFEDKNNSGP